MIRYIPMHAGTAAATATATVIHYYAAATAHHAAATAHHAAATDGRNGHAYDPVLILVLVVLCCSCSCSSCGPAAGCKFNGGTSMVASSVAGIWR